MNIINDFQTKVNTPSELISDNNNQDHNFGDTSQRLAGQGKENFASKNICSSSLSSILDKVSKQYTYVPEDLKQQNNWVLYRLEKGADEDKLKKIPYSFCGKRASSTCQKDWTSFENAISALATKNFDGIGFVFSSSDQFCGIDIDHCIDEKGTMTDEAVYWMKKFEGSYIERSISGSGIHIIAKGHKPSQMNSRKGSIEIYDQKRYFTVSGDMIFSPASIPVKQAEIEELYTSLFENKEEANTEERREIRTKRREKSEQTKITEKINMSEETQRIIKEIKNSLDEHKFLRLSKNNNTGYTSASEADLAFCNVIAKRTDKYEHILAIVQNSSRYREKWNRIDYAERTIYKAIKSASKFRKMLRRNVGPPKPQVVPLQIGREEIRKSILENISQEKENLLLAVTCGAGKTHICIEEIEKDKTHRYIYVTQTNKKIDEFHAEHPDWHRIHGRSQRILESDKGNCINSNEIQKTIKNGVFQNKICSQSCKMWKICNAEKGWYLEQFKEKEKNICCTQDFLSMGGFRLSGYFHRIIVDESAKSSLLKESVKIPFSSISKLRFTEFNLLVVQALQRLCGNVRANTKDENGGNLKTIKIENEYVTGGEIIEYLHKSLFEIPHLRGSEFEIIKNVEFLEIEPDTDEIKHEGTFGSMRELAFAIQEEATRYEKYGKDNYNSIIWMDNKGNIQIPKTQNIKKFVNESSGGVVYLDATPDVAIAEAYTGVKFEKQKHIHIEIPEKVLIFQIKSGKYCLATFRNTENGDNVKEAIREIIHMPVMNKTGVVALKSILKDIEAEDLAAHTNYYAVAGLNSMKDLDNLFIVGDPEINPATLKMYYSIVHPEKVSFAYNENNGYYEDERIQEFVKNYRENEMMQAIGRIRYILKEKCNIYIISNIVLSDIHYKATKVSSLNKMKSIIKQQNSNNKMADVMQEWKEYMIKNIFVGGKSAFIGEKSVNEVMEAIILDITRFFGNNGLSRAGFYKLLKEKLFCEKTASNLDPFMGEFSVILNNSNTEEEKEKAIFLSISVSKIRGAWEKLISMLKSENIITSLKLNSGGKDKICNNVIYATPEAMEKIKIIATDKKVHSVIKYTYEDFEILAENEKDNVTSDILAKYRRIEYERPVRPAFILMEKNHGIYKIAKEERARTYVDLLPSFPGMSEPAEKIMYNPKMRRFEKWTMQSI